MKIVFKQLIDGLVYTSTITDKHSYISVDGREHPLVFQSPLGEVDALQLHLCDKVTGLPMHYKENCKHHLKAGNLKAAGNYLPFLPAEELKMAADYPGVLEAHLKDGETYWAEQLAKLKSIEDGTYWLTEQPVFTLDDLYAIDLGDGFTPCEIAYDNTIRTGDGEYVLFANSREAGEAARAYWADMSKNDKEEFACIVGTDTLVEWALGNMAGGGTKKVSSLEEWLDLWLGIPEEHWASYDGKEVTAVISQSLADALSISTSCVAYRSN